MNAFHVDDYLIVISPFHSSSCATLIEEEQTQTMLIPLVFLFFSILLICFLSISLYQKLRKQDECVDDTKTHDPKFSLSSTINKLHQNNKPHSLLLEFLTSVSSHFPVGDDPLIDGSELDKDGVKDLVGEDCEKSEKKKKKKKRGKKKRQNSQVDDEGEETRTMESDVSALQHKHCLYPFTSSSSVTQRKLKHQYDQLVKCNATKGLTIAQVGEFVNCLVEARNDLQHKSEIIKRKFTITKALLLKADRSSFDRLSQQLYKLEAEQKRLEEDANVYNRLQQQLKLSPAYKKMVEIGARMELKATPDQIGDNTETDFPDISFEELLAQEKKDTFWQNNGKLRSCRNLC